MLPRSYRVEFIFTPGGMYRLEAFEDGRIHVRAPAGEHHARESERLHKLAMKLITETVPGFSVRSQLGEITLVPPAS